MSRQRSGARLGNTTDNDAVGRGVMCDIPIALSTCRNGSVCPVHRLIWKCASKDLPPNARCNGPTDRLFEVAPKPKKKKNVKEAVGRRVCRRDWWSCCSEKRAACLYTTGGCGCCGTAPVQDAVTCAEWRNMRRLVRSHGRRTPLCCLPADWPTDSTTPTAENKAGSGFYRNDLWNSYRLNGSE